ncbi:Hypothetical protein PACV_368 [Pacmanvirus A23]|uniref:Hypothetical protein n=1 Tax=Pacmanvirus A23 TaxID=1932881 RepID=UPI000A093FBA|nr:Hypothetical protein B9W72_gp364 [Pacmanvirus A23]SIP86081.1 Hypothetical protein PACV_368 [Pacmanvirus A23]
MTESLYYLTLRCLRQNPHLINFKELNYQTRIDMFKVIENKNHLRKMFICRKIYNLTAIYNYIAFTYKNNTDFVETYKCPQSIDTSRLQPYLGGTFVCGSKIYDPNRKLTYRVIYKNISPFEYKIISRKTAIKYSAILNKCKVIIPDNIHDEEFFKNFPGLLDNGVDAGYISERMIISMDAVKKL